MTYYNLSYGTTPMHTPRTIPRDAAGRPLVRTVFLAAVAALAAKTDLARVRELLTAGRFAEAVTVVTTGTGL